MPLDVHQSFLLCLLVVSSSAYADLDFAGHAKYQPLVSSFPSDSYFREFTDSPAIDNNGDVRLTLDWQKNKWAAEADYQLLAKFGDSVELYNSFGGLEVIAPFFPSDDYRVMNLTDYLVEEDDAIVVQRLDRLNVSWLGESTVIKIGRQAISWGNGLIFNPMDIFNPFDPTAVDKEYKTGDDMVYAQSLLNSGDDVQFVWVGRRDKAGDINGKVTSMAAKYHGFYQSVEYDVLLADHYDETLFSLGVVAPLGDAIVRADIVTNHTQNGDFYSAVLNWSYSWVWSDKNVSGSLEYFRNGVGIWDGDYNPIALVQNPELLKRLNRGESFNLGRDYLASSLTIEMHPLWIMTPTAFLNINDQSVFLQLTSTHDLRENLQALLSINAPFGDDGSEFGGIATGLPDRYLSAGPSIFAQLAWYY